MKKQRKSSAPDILEEIRSSTAPGMDPAEVDRLIRSHFSGRRTAIRTYRALDCEAHGGHGAFKALAMDASRSGVLLRITDPSFALPHDLDDLMAYSARVSFHFEQEFRLTFLEGELSVAAQVVRVTGHAGVGNASGIMLLGCRFGEELGRRECDLLGISSEDDRAPGDDLG
ncbi:MAG: PilZ domain-containing protein [Planctomycetaceae bacterium]